MKFHLLVPFFSRCAVLTSTTHTFQPGCGISAADSFALLVVCDKCRLQTGSPVSLNSALVSLNSVPFSPNSVLVSLFTVNLIIYQKSTSLQSAFVAHHVVVTGTLHSFI